MEEPDCEVNSEAEPEAELDSTLEDVSKVAELDTNELDTNELEPSPEVFEVAGELEADS